MSFDVYQTVTDTIIRALEDGSVSGRYELPWVRRNPIPVNVASGKAYRGINVPLLWAAAQSRGYPHGVWGTYKQWQEMGAQVRKGEKGTLVVFWKFFDTAEAEQEDEGEAGEGRGRRCMVRGYTVFNAGQVDGYTVPEAAAPASYEARMAQADAFMDATGFDIRYGFGEAYYSPTLDFIALPDRTAFRATSTSTAEEAFQSTRFHEAVHMTGHSSRLARDFSGRFGSEAYAAEELVAELGAAFLCAQLGVSPSVRADHTKYIAGWLKVLKNDKRAIFTAASKAQAAVDFLNSLQAAAEEEDRAAA